jgi:hypothetical protein
MRPILPLEAPRNQRTRLVLTETRINHKDSKSREEKTESLSLVFESLWFIRLLRNSLLNVSLDLPVKLLHHLPEIVFVNINDTHLTSGILFGVARMRRINHHCLPKFTTY